MPRFVKGSPAAKAHMAKIRKAKQTGTSDKKIDRTKQAKPVGKRTSANGKVYYETRANRSDKGKFLGVDDNINSDILNQYLDTISKIEKYEKMLIFNKDNYKKASDIISKNHYKYIINLCIKYIKELKQQKIELKKLM